MGCAACLACAQRIKRGIAQNEKQKEIAHKHQNNVGELIGFSSELIVFYNNKMYYVYDENLKEISHKHENNLSQFKNVVGRTITFTNGKMLYVYDEKLKEISHKWL